MSKSDSELTAMEEIGQVPDSRDVFAGPVLRSFGNLMERRIACTETIKQLEEEKKKIDNSLTTLMTDHDTVKVSYEGRSVSLCQGSRSSLNKEKLLLAGVPATTILKCTDQSSYTYLLVGKAKT